MCHKRNPIQIQSPLNLSFKWNTLQHFNGTVVTYRYKNTHPANVLRMTVILFSNIQLSFWFLCSSIAHIYMCVMWNGEYIRRGRWWVIWKMRRTDEKTKMSRDVRHRMRHSLEIGPRRNNLSYPHTSPTLSQVGERRMDRRERKGGETVAIELCRSRYIVQLCFHPCSHPAASPIVNVTNTGDIFCYIITTILLSMNKREIDYLLYDVQSFI